MNTIIVIKRFSQKFGPIILIVLFSLIVSIIQPRFISIRNIMTIFQQMVPVGLIALGQTFVIISGGIDLTTGVNIALVSITSGVVYGITNNIYTALIAGVAIALAVSLINILLIVKLKLSPVISTIGMMTIISGLVLVIASVFEKVIFIEHGFFNFIARATVFNIPFSFILMVIFYLIAFVFLNYHKFGTYTVSIGNSEVCSLFAGINLNKYKSLIYIISGFFSSIAGIVLLSRMSLVQPVVSGSFTLLLDSIAAVIIGGTRMSGGKGTIAGTFFGVILISIIGNVLNILNADPNFRDTIKGLIIIAALIFDRFVNE